MHVDDNCRKRSERDADDELQQHLTLPLIMSFIIYIDNTHLSSESSGDGGTSVVDWCTFQPILFQIKSSTRVYISSKSLTCILKVYEMIRNDN